VHRPPGLIEHEVAAAQQARLAGFGVLAGVPVKIMSFSHGVCGVYGVYGVVPAHPRGTRVRRRGGRR